MEMDEGSEQTFLQRRENGQKARHRHSRGKRESKPRAVSHRGGHSGELETGAAEQRGPPACGGDTAQHSLCQEQPEAAGQMEAAPRNSPAREPALGTFPKEFKAGPRRGASTPTSVTASLTARGRGRRPASESSPRGPEPGPQDRRVDKGDVCVQWNVTRPLTRRQPVTCSVTCYSMDEPHGTMLSRIGQVQESKGHRPPPEEVSKVVEIRSRKQCGRRVAARGSRASVPCAVTAATRVKAPKTTELNASSSYEGKWSAILFFFSFTTLKKKGKEESAYLFERGWGLIVSHIKPPPPSATMSSIKAAAYVVSSERLNAPIRCPVTVLEPCRT